MSNALTPTEEKVYQYLIEFLAANSYQPSIREIGRRFEIKSTKTVSDILGSLARKGYIQRNQARSRGLRILGSPAAATRVVPFYAQLAALGPPLSPDLRTDSIVIDRRLAPGEGSFFVRALDSALASCGIRANDTVLINPDFGASDGDLVGVRVGTQVAIRIYEQRGNDAALVAPALDVPTIDIPPGDDQLVLGVVSAVFRGVLIGVGIDGEAEAAA